MENNNPLALLREVSDLWAQMRQQAGAKAAQAEGKKETIGEDKNAGKRLSQN